MRLYFKEHIIKVYEMKVSNNSKIIENIILNKSGETFKNHCNSKRRPRLNFESLKTQTKKYCKLLFNGTFEELQELF